MTSGGEPRTLNLEGADVSDFKIMDEPKMDFAFGGRYTSDEYIQVENENGKERRTTWRRRRAARETASATLTSRRF